MSSKPSKGSNHRSSTKHLQSSKFQQWEFTFRKQLLKVGKRSSMYVEWRLNDVGEVSSRCVREITLHEENLAISHADKGVLIDATSLLCCWFSSWCEHGFISVHSTTTWAAEHDGLRCFFYVCKLKCNEALRVSLRHIMASSSRWVAKHLAKSWACRKSNESTSFVALLFRMVWTTEKLPATTDCKTTDRWTCLRYLSIRTKRQKRVTTTTLGKLMLYIGTVLRAHWVLRRDCLAFSRISSAANLEMFEG